MASNSTGENATLRTPTEVYNPPVNTFAIAIGVILVFVVCAYTCAYACAHTCCRKRART